MPLLVFLLVGCGDDRAPAGTTGEASTNDRAQTRTLHARLLDREPGLEDLPEELLGVANACRLDESHPVCKWGHETLGREDWKRIEAAWEEQDRRAAELESMLDACRERDEAALESMYPGRFAFYQMVRSPPEYVETPVDAVVAIGISSAPRGKAQRAIRDGMASEGLQVQYGGPRLRDYSPNQYSARSNTETFFYGYYTPEIEARMDRPRPECDRLRSTPFIQAACRRDVAVSIVRDWMESRGHRSVRFIVSGQSSWPEYELLFDEYLGDREAMVDAGSFSDELRRDSSFLREMCAPAAPDLWLDYEFYVRRLFPGG
jgi:hypothetical protein